MLWPTHSFYTLWLMLGSCVPAVTGAAKKPTNNSHRDQNTRPPNVILLLAEDMGLGDLACYGHPYARTPNLDRLAAEGTRFTRFYVAGATCNPSRSGIMSSRNPATIPNYQADFGFPENMPTITKLLHDAGYKVGHVGKWHIGPIHENTTENLGMDEVKITGGTVSNSAGKDARVYENGIDFIERHKDVPFYLNLWSHVAHSPVKPGKELLREFDDVEVKRSDFDRYMQKKFDSAQKLGGENAVNTGMRRYLADIWGMDLMIGRLMDKLDELGIRDNTILAFTADHGAAPILVDKQSTPTSMMGWGGGLKGSKHTFYEGGLRVPFILRWPGHIPAGKVNDKSIVSALDWLPTICNLAGVSIDRDMFDGENVADIWLGEKQRSRKDPLFWKFSRESSERAVVYGKWKLFASRQGRFSLHELDHDSAESEDLTEKVPEIASEMKQSLLKWEQSLPSQYCNMKQGCETPIPFDGSSRPIYVGPPQILVADGAGSIQKPPFDYESYADEVSKINDAVLPSGIGKSDSTLGPTPMPTTAPTSTRKQEEEEKVSYDGEDLYDIEGTLKPSSKPNASTQKEEEQHSETSDSGTPAYRYPTASPVFAVTPTSSVDLLSPLVDGDSAKSPSKQQSKDQDKKVAEEDAHGEADNVNDTEWQPDPAVTSSAEITQRARGLSLITGCAVALSVFVLCWAETAALY
mmetsp:Transcript_24045/g.52063  ORF Transcript_24045/g.52063 Transcript_24045/m.52063 type:complete len:693 (+) Transcript_24045:340-2418(+)